MSNRKYDIENKVYVDGDKVVTQHTQDCEQVVKSVNQLRHVDGGKKKYGYHAARIPQVLLMEWALEDAGDKLAYLQGKHNRDPELAKKLAVRLNSNEFQAFRIWNGEVAASDITKEGNKF